MRRQHKIEQKHRSVAEKKRPQTHRDPNYSSGATAGKDLAQSTIDAQPEIVTLTQLLGRVSMSNLLVKGAVGKFSEAFGSGLAYGIVAVLAIMVLKYWFLQDEPIGQFTKPTTICASNGHNCEAEATCGTDFIAIGGECTVTNFPPDGRPVSLQNFGILEARDGSKESRRFLCNWRGPGADATLGVVIQVEVRAACINKARFGIPIPGVSQK